MSTQIGLIAYLDILGYKNLLEKNEPEDIAKNVLPLLSSIDKDVILLAKKELIEVATEKEKTNIMIDNIIETIKFIVISDSIVVAIPCEYQNQFKDVLCWVILFSILINLQGNLFISGLPLRGVINYGKYYLEKNCFAGRPIVEAY